MRVLTSLSIGFAAFLSALGTAQAGGDSGYTGAVTTGIGQYDCIGMVQAAVQGAVKNYFYTTAAFPVPNKEISQLLLQWHNYLQSQYPGALVSLSNCGAAQADPAEEQAHMQGWIDRYKSQAATIRTTWKYGQP